MGPTVVDDVACSFDDWELAVDVQITARAAFTGKTLCTVRLLAGDSIAVLAREVEASCGLRGPLRLLSRGKILAHAATVAASALENDSIVDVVQSRARSAALVVGLPRVVGEKQAKLRAYLASIFEGRIKKSERTWAIGEYELLMPCDESVSCGFAVVSLANLDLLTQFVERFNDFQLSRSHVLNVAPVDALDELFASGKVSSDVADAIVRSDAEGWWSQFVVCDNE
eukprot:TRINITY_DN80163_c0_g1_i1.p1 TRINITY_DN80163_c0_g1~~TRINITY_DN80163_c0_g1_i1.p1  ORF type:complete len:227 (-),score=35.22 TRINITY_DN80163_c0_g1_i1:149-829(-)